MREKNFYRCSVGLLIGVVSLGANSVIAASGVWRGASDGFWVNSANWSAAPYAGYEAGETASFTNSTGSTVLDLSGLGSIFQIVFDTSSAAYTIGNATDTLVLEDDGAIEITAAAANAQRVDADIQMGAGDASATYTLRNNNVRQMLAVNKIKGTTGGVKNLVVEGSGAVSVSGGIDKAGGYVDLDNNGTGVLTLSGNNSLRELRINSVNGVINIASGNTTVSNGGGTTLTSSQNCTINGPGKLTLGTSGDVNYGDNGAETGTTMTINAPISGVNNAGFEYWHGSYRGTIALLGANDYSGLTIMNVAGTIMCTNINNNGTVGNLGAGNAFRHNGGGSRLLYTGAGQDTDRTIEMYTSGIIEQGGSGNLNFTSDIVLSGGTKTLTLQGSTAGLGEWSGLLRNSEGVLNMAKAGSGTWSLSADNAYSGSTAVNAGTLVLSGPDGAITNSAENVIDAGAVLRLRNTASANNGDRLSDTGTLALKGGAFEFDHDADDATSYNETIGTVKLVSGRSVVSADQAAIGQTSTLTISAFDISGGTVDFVGVGLGSGGRNRILITGQPDGMIGPWATVNGGTAYAAYSGILGVHASSSIPVGIAARGPSSVIPNDAAAQVVIDEEGTAGPIVLEGAFTNTTFILTQNTNTPATVQTLNGATSKTMRISTVKINADRAALTIGENEGDGTVMAQSVGGIVVLQNDSVAELKVNAALADNTSASHLIKRGSGDVRLTGANTYTGGTAIEEGKLLIDGSSDQTLFGVISGAGALTKEGSGSLTISGNNSYEGVTTIRDGVVYVENNNALGAKTAGTVIEPGGTLEVAGTLSANTFNLDSEMITVSGTGYNGMGAIINDVGGYQYSAFRQITLAGDTTFSANLRWDMRNTNGDADLYMNDYDLTKIGTDLFVLVSTDAHPGSGNVNVEEGTFSCEAYTDMRGDSNNVMTVANEAVFDWYTVVNAIDWSLVLQDGAKVHSRYGNELNRNIWAGPVALNGAASLQGVLRSSHTIAGSISGSGSVLKNGDASVYLRNTNNTYTGATTVNKGMLYAEHVGSLPGYNTTGRITVNGGDFNALAVKAGDGNNGWNNAQIKELHDTALFYGVDARLGIDTDGGDLDYPYNFSVPMGISKLGDGVLTIPSGQSLEAAVNVYGGELVLNNIENHMADKNCYIGVNSGDTGILTLRGNTSLIGYVPSTSTGTQSIFVGEYGRGILKIEDNTVITNKFMVGVQIGSAGAVYQSGGVFESIAAAGNDGRLGYFGYGYYDLSGGYLRLWGYSQLGVAPGSVGILNFSDGLFEVSGRSGFYGNLGLSRGGTGIFYQSGGLFTTSEILEIGDDYSNDTTGGYAVYSVEGGEGEIRGDILMANRDNMFAALNFNGGRVSANRIYRNSVRVNTKAYVNFDGGTYQERNGGDVIDGGANAPDAVNIFAGGAVIDSQAYSCAMPVPLLAPIGKGVGAINITPTGGYVGPPHVTFSGGGGEGTTAVADFDSESGVVTGITVTSPGFGYTSAPTVTLSGGGAAEQAPVGSVTLSSNVSGGLTKIGSGTLVLNAANTYSGTTVISNGCLTLGVVNALPIGADVSVDGGTYCLGGFTVTNGAVSLTAGSISEGVLVCDSLTKSAAGELAVTANLKSAAPIVISGGSMKLVGRQPGLYSGVLSGDFNTVDPNPKAGIELTTSQANIVFTEPYDTTWIYSGFVWNNGVTDATWTFAESFDDQVRLVIDGNVVIADGAGWNIPTKANYTLTPGAHSFEVRFGQGGGGGGPSDNAHSGWFVTDRQIGFGVDFLGRDAEVPGNYQRMVDPGDGTLFTTTVNSNNDILNPSSTVLMAAGTTLDLGGTVQSLETLSGSGTISNGTLSVTTTLAPGGVNTIGTMTIDAALALNCELLIDVASNGGSDLLVVDGNLDLTSATLRVANPSQLDISRQYTIASCGGTVNAPFAAIEIDDPKWEIKVKPGGLVTLICQRGTLMILR